MPYIQSKGGNNSSLKKKKLLAVIQIRELLSLGVLDSGIQLQCSLSSLHQGSLGTTDSTGFVVTTLHVKSQMPEVLHS